MQQTVREEHDVQEDTAQKTITVSIATITEERKGLGLITRTTIARDVVELKHQGLKEYNLAKCLQESGIQRKALISLAKRGKVERVEVNQLDREVVSRVTGKQVSTWCSKLGLERGQETRYTVEHVDLFKALEEIVRSDKDKRQALIKFLAESPMS